MQWFKHDSNANTDEKLQEVLLDYGLEGYGLYWYCLELIVNKVDKDNVTFELKHDARIIAKNTGSTVQKVEEMMKSFIKHGLFENNAGRITCLKLLKRMDSSMTSNKFMRELIVKANESHDAIMTQSANLMKEENRIDENRIDNKTIGRAEALDDGFDEFWNYYPKKVGKDKAKTEWTKKKPNIDDVLEALKWQKQSEQWDKGFIPNPATYISQGRWKDEPIVKGVPF